MLTQGCRMGGCPPGGMQDGGMPTQGCRMGGCPPEGMQDGGMLTWGDAGWGDAHLGGCLRSSLDARASMARWTESITAPGCRRAPTLEGLHHPQPRQPPPGAVPVNNGACGCLPGANPVSRARRRSQWLLGGCHLRPGPLGCLNRPWHPPRAQPPHATSPAPGGKEEFGNAQGPRAGSCTHQKLNPDSLARAPPCARHTSPLIPAMPTHARQRPVPCQGGFWGAGGSKALPSREPMARRRQVCLSAGSHACAEHPLPCAARRVATATASRRNRLEPSGGGCAGGSFGLSERWRMCRSLLQPR